MVKPQCDISLALKDTFRVKIMILIEKGFVANSSGRFLKYTTERLVQKYASQLMDPRFPVSDLVLKIEEMMLSGEFSRIPDSAFKLWLVLSALGGMNSSGELDRSRLQEMTGLNTAEMRQGFAYLQSTRFRLIVDKHSTRKTNRF